MAEFWMFLVLIESQFPSLRPQSRPVTTSKEIAKLETATNVTKQNRPNQYLALKKYSYFFEYLYSEISLVVVINTRIIGMKQY